MKTLLITADTYDEYQDPRVETVVVRLTDEDIREIMELRDELHRLNKQFDVYNIEKFWGVETFGWPEDPEIEEALHEFDWVEIEESNVEVLSPVDSELSSISLGTTYVTWKGYLRKSGVEWESRGFSYQSLEELLERVA